MRNSNHALVVHLHLDHRRHISEEAAMHGNPHPAALAGFLLSPVRFLRRHLQRRAATARYRRDISRRTPGGPCGPTSRVRGDPIRRHQVIVRIAIRRIRQLIRERLHRERVINIRHRPQPADAHMRHRLSVFRAEVRHVERHHAPSHRHFARAAINVARCQTSTRSAETTDRCSHAFGLPASSSAAFIYMAATEW